MGKRKLSDARALDEGIQEVLDNDPPHPDTQEYTSYAYATALIGTVAACY